MSKPMASSVVGIGPTWFNRRQLGLKSPLGTKSHIFEQMYSNILPCGCWDHTLNNTYTTVHGGVFSLEFSPEGSLLVAACEKRSILVFDPLTHKRIQSVENAHSDCVNCVRFLDSRSFATCSDDFTVALWDARNLNQKVRSLKGHSNWVKNIEYSPQDGLLVTSGFDGSILTWEMNKYRDDGLGFNKVFSTNGLMRTRLTPDATKMVICTTGGYLIIIHNLDLNTLSQDLEGFKPNMYRLMQLSQTILPIASDFTHLFRGQGKRNRVEFITDFPEGDDAEVVSSLQIHPDGHSAVSRNVSSNEKSEWSCIHNIEERYSSDESDELEDEEEDSDGSKLVSWPGTSSSISTTPSYIIQHTVVQNEAGSSESGRNTEQRDLSVSPSDVWEALVAIQEARIRRETDRMESEMSVGHLFRRQAVDAGIQVRPPNPDGQIFTTPISPNSSSSNNSDDGSRNVSNSTPIFRRNVSVNTNEVNPPGSSNQSCWTSLTRNSGLKYRKKLPVRQRYTSLYRRSLVGQYDRTTILRKPIYNYKINNFKIKKIKDSFTLNTNYEMNETQRLQNESGDCRHPLNFNVMSNTMREQASSSGSRLQEGPRTALGKRINLVLKKGEQRVTRTRTPTPSINPLSTAANDSNSLSQSSSSLESNLNLFRQTIANAEDTINSNCSGMSSYGDASQTGINHQLREGAIRNSNHNQIVLESVENEAANNRNLYSVSENVANRNVTAQGTNQVLELGSSQENHLHNGDLGEVETSLSSSSQSDILSSVSPSNSERTILMSVFRAGNEDGVRGTSMRRHNVATVTVSSPPQRLAANSLVNRLNFGRSKNRCDTNSKTNINENSSVRRYPVVPVNKKIHQNTKRLTHYIEEPNLGRGFIKELCVSPDGRIICSPFGNGIRLLSFSPTVQDVFHCYPQSPPIPLHELTLNIAHTDIVVSTKFSPFHNLLVTGCLSGKIVYYQPFL